MFHIHEWSQWSELVSHYTSEKQQWKYCKKCNIQKYRNTGITCSDLNDIQAVIDKLKDNK